MATSRELAAKSSGVTTEMVDAAMAELSVMGVRSPLTKSKECSDRDIMYDALRAALATISSEAPREVTKLVMDENEWMEFWETCAVVVHDPKVGSKMLGSALENLEAFAAIVDTIAENKSLVVPLLKYPGLKFFGSDE